MVDTPVKFNVWLVKSGAEGFPVSPATENKDKPRPVLAGLIKAWETRHSTGKQLLSVWPAAVRPMPLTLFFGRNPHSLAGVVDITGSLLESFLGGVDHEIAVSRLLGDF